jgi:hypothetical protein
MDTIQPPTPSIPIPPPRQNVFGTKVPSTVSFAVGIILFLLPFAEVKCNGSTLATNTGLGIATGKEWKMPANSLFGNESRGGPSKADDEKKKAPNTYAIIALVLGAAGLILSLTGAKVAAGSAMVVGILSAGALIGLMIDLKRQLNEPLPGKTAGEMDNVVNNIKVTMNFTPWYYIAVIAFLAAAFFCYKRLAPK